MTNSSWISKGDYSPFINNQNVVLLSTFGGIIFNLIFLQNVMFNIGDTSFFSVILATFQVSGK